MAFAAILLAFPTVGSAREPLKLEDRVAAQRAIEQVYWAHRSWPNDNPAPKPPLSAVMRDEAIAARVDDYLRKSSALEVRWQRPITGEQLQRELDRMARRSGDRAMLRELFQALGNDPYLIAETLARQTLADRLCRNWYEGELPRAAGTGETFDAWWANERSSLKADSPQTTGTFTLPMLTGSACTRDTWDITHVDVPDGRSGHVAVWTGSEMIVWGGIGDGGQLVTGSRYDPATDTWTAMSLKGYTPSPRRSASTIWTGTEMILWGGTLDGVPYSNAGVRYNPTTDEWREISVGAGTPQGRTSHTAVWTGSEMIVWGGNIGTFPGTSAGGRYNPVSDSWTPTAVDLNTPTPRLAASAVWTGTEMIVWGGSPVSGSSTAGGRYNPATDTWQPVATGGSEPSQRSGHTAVWTGTEMIVWGGGSNTGGRYSPSTNSWVPTSTVNAPSGGTGNFAAWTGSRMLAWNDTGGIYNPQTDTWTAMAPAPPLTASGRTVVWTGQEMIAWGGTTNWPLNTGARYRPDTNSWVPTSTFSTVPAPTIWASTVWTGNEMIVWGGYLDRGFAVTNTGGRYMPATDVWVPTPVNAQTPSARSLHSGVWTGREMIVWGGNGLSTGGRYDPIADAWAPTSNGANVPSGRAWATTVWTGAEMLVWGGNASQNCAVGGRYDPVHDSWLAMSIVNAPDCRNSHAAVWTGTEMIVWGGWTNTGGRYDPRTDTWRPTTLVNVPTGRKDFTAVWTGKQMIVWGGSTPSGSVLNTGGRYDPVGDVWLPTSTGANVPPACDYPAAVWSGLEMLVFHGCGNSLPQASGGARYDPGTDAWLPMASWPLSTTTFDRGSAAWTGDRMLIWGGGANSSTGGSYCGCPRLHNVYRDADGDGHGDAGTSIVTCDDQSPVGYAEDATDCNDQNAAIHPDAVETCNNLDDNCDGVVDNGGASLCDDGNACTTDACAGVNGCTHAPTTGPCDDGNPCTIGDSCIDGYCAGAMMPPLPETRKLLAAADKATFSWSAMMNATQYDVVRGSTSGLPVGSNTTDEVCFDNLADTSLTDPGVPSRDGGFWYLSRGENRCGAGSYGMRSDGSPRVTTSCP